MTKSAPIRARSSEQHTEPVETLHLAALLDRAAYLGHLDKQRGGPTPSREYEARAIDWAIRRLCEIDPKVAQLLPRAVARAEERIRNSGWKL